MYESTINEDILNISFDIVSKNPDVVAFSCYIWNIENTLKVANTIKNINENIKIVLGGPEVSFDSIELINKYNFIDFIIKGEGEKVIKPLIDSIYSNSLEGLRSIKGLTYRENLNMVDTGFAETITDLDSIKFPYEDEIPDKIIYYEASRGCPFRCSYCMSSIDKRVRFRSLDLVKKELKYLIDNNVKLVKFVDRTFNANKNFSREIWKYLIELSPSTRFHFEIAADLLEDEDIEILKMAKEGLFQFEVGVQTTNIKVLENINRKMNFERVKENINKILQIGNIHCHLDLIVGLPEEDINSFIKSFNDVMSINPDELQIGFLKVLKGSPIYYDKDKYGIKYCGYAPYQVLKTNTLSSQEISYLLKFEEVFETFYNSHIFERTFNYVFNYIDDCYIFFKELTDYLIQNGFFKRSIGLQDKFFQIFNFLINRFEGNTIKDLLIYDYLYNTKKTNLPEFLKKRIDEDVETKIKICKERIVNTLSLSNLKGLLILPMSLDARKINRSIEFNFSDFLVIFDLKNNGHYAISLKELV
ncbi:anaerobic magnesium-protoporphyrin IX monomethyl ester cyclase [Caloramator proteoclasticus DSM 10124]|uniref:Anaerobic magnesium-protoporphyrin IX monomethyl ester cyclase n=1 Tax=Caloramator proteoclasticus DSM 10124 TaxID=1121262 RepID=A0A1M5C2W8_9CLOT|nr:anaerobic magnesium-protoporphyrin IX monomethyl ester cyclase [Caloramator proteoclasticus DSM 10124]